MIFTLILFSSVLSLLHYLGLQEYLLIFLSLPLEYYIGATAALIAGRVILALYRLIPVYRRFVSSLERTSTRLDMESRTMKGNANSPSQTRRFSTSTRRLTSKTNSFITVKTGVSKINLTTPLNVISLLRSKYVVIDKMVSLSNKIGTTLHVPFAINNMLAHGRIGRLARGIRRTNDFVNYVLKLWKAHGTAFTIKWLKASHVAIAKCLGNNKLLSLRTLEQDLNLPRLVNGLPKIIPYEDRRRMRQGHVPTIRFWLGLFNLYRILKAPATPKLATITAPWTGNFKPFLELCRIARRPDFNFFCFLKGFKHIDLQDVQPTEMVSSSSASPSNKISWQGFLTDLHLLRERNPALLSAIKRYIHLTGGYTFVDMLEHALEIDDIFSKYDFYRDSSSSEGYHLSKSGKPILPADHSMAKPAIAQYGIPTGDGLSQFAIKEEAAGKVRIFALVDCITQSVLRPLHDKLFSLLRLIPCDGTFNQEAALDRAMFKAVKANCAFSFDLSAATDRIPVLLTQNILANILNSSEAGRLWKTIMTHRTFGFLQRTAEKLGLDHNTGYRYAVGQPMGALSSWAGLAITHHWIVQVAAREAYYDLEGWYENYEVLGDDIVIFDPLVADKYLNIMSEIGTEINLTKSIVSRNRPVFEFAKRICWGSGIVSGISLNQVRSSWNVGSRLASVLQFARLGLLEAGSSLMVALLSRDAFSKGKATLSVKTESPRAQKARALGLLALLGERYQKGILSLKEVTRILINPKDYLDEGNAIAIPLQFATQLAYRALVDPQAPHPIPSQVEERDRIWGFREPFLKQELMDAITSEKQLLISEMVSLSFSWTEHMFWPLRYKSSEEFIPQNDLPVDYLHAYWELSELVTTLFHTKIVHRYDVLLGTLSDLEDQFWEDEGGVSLETLFGLRGEIESLRSAIKIKDALKPKTTLMETAKPIKEASALAGTVPSWWTEQDYLENSWRMG